MGVLHVSQYKPGVTLVYLGQLFTAPKDGAVRSTESVCELLKQDLPGRVHFWHMAKLLPSKPWLG